MDIQAPQVIWIVLTIFVLFCEAMQDGEPKTGKHSLPLEMLDSALVFLLLYWGGFFT